VGSEYGPLYDSRPDDPFDGVQEHFAEASRPFLTSPLSWLVWALSLPAAALLTPAAHRQGGESWVLLLWSFAILVGGVTEALLLLRRGAASKGRGAARWALRLQGNLSLVGLALSVVLLWVDQVHLLPGLWLLLVGHSFFALGGLAFRGMRTCGVIYQLGGAAALWPSWPGLELFAVTTFVGNLWLAVTVWKRSSF